MAMIMRKPIAILMEVLTWVLLCLASIGIFHFQGFGLRFSLRSVARDASPLGRTVVEISSSVW